MTAELATKAPGKVYTGQTALPLTEKEKYEKEIKLLKAALDSNAKPGSASAALR